MTWLPQVRVSLIREGRLAGHGRVCKSPLDAAGIFREMLEDRDREVFAVLLLDVHLRPLSVSVVSVGTLNMGLVEPRGVFTAALLAAAGAVIGAHNHPSGSCNPSPEDRAVHTRLQKAGVILGIPYHDSLVIGEGAYYSLTEGFPVTFPDAKQG